MPRPSPGGAGASGACGEPLAVRALVTGLLLLLLAAVTLPRTAAAIEALLGDPRNLILPAHFLLMITLGIALVAGGRWMARRAIIGAIAGAIAALVADLGWLLAIAG